MRPRLILLFVILSLTVWSCRRKVVVYADPWLRDYANEVVEEFEAAHHEVDVELKIISSEVIATYVRFGQPIDVLLVFGPEVIERVGVAAKLDSKHVLAQERMAWVAAKDQGKFELFGTQGCMVVEASQRPGRLMADAFMAGNPETRRGARILIADFQRQLQDYLLRGWVPKGIVPQSFANRKSETLQTLSTGQVIPEAYSAFLTRQAVDNPDAGTFFSFLKTKKSQEILARQGLFP